MQAVDEDNNIIIAVLCWNGCEPLPQEVLNEHVLDEGAEV